MNTTAVGLRDSPGTPRDLRLVPLAIAAWVGTWLATAEPPPLLEWAVACLALAAGLIGWGRRSWWVVAACAVAITGLGIGSVRVHVLRSGTLADWAREGAAVTCTVHVRSDPRVLRPRPTRPATGVVAASTVACDARGLHVRQALPITVRATGDAVLWLTRLVPGSTVRLSGLLREPSPGEPVVAIVMLRADPHTLSPPGPGARAVNHFRGTLRAVGRASPPDQRALLPSLVVGDTSQVSEQMTEEFRATALTHLMAVSGANLALTLIVVMSVARWVGLRGWWLRVLAVFSVAGFVMVCRAEPSVIRAAGMGLVALAALGRGATPGRGVRHLAGAVVALVLIDPWLARSVGFTLSVAACGGILWWSARWTAAMHRWAPRWVAEAISVPIAAQLATQPVVTSLNGEVSVVGLAANAAAAPFVGPATILGLMAGVVGVVWLPAGVVVGWVAGWALAPILWISRAGAALPTATWSWPQSPTALVVLSLICALVAMACSQVFSRRWLSLGLAIIMVFATLRPQPSPGWPGSWQVVACSVGQGDAWVLRADRRSAVLVDVGPDPAPVVGCLRALGVRQVPLVILTHYHADHITGLAAVLEGFAVGQLLVSPLASPASHATRIAGLADDAGVPISQAVPGQIWTVGEVAWRTIRAGPVSGAPVAVDEGESAAENDSSVMGVATVGRVTVLLAGDSEPPAQAAALASGSDLRALIMAMPHHGSARQDERFWKASGAVLAVASAGLDNDYGHPARAALRLAATCGMRVARTDTQGSVAIWVSAGRLEVRTRAVS